MSTCTLFVTADSGTQNPTAQSRKKWRPCRSWVPSATSGFHFNPTFTLLLMRANSHRSAALTWQPEESNKSTEQRNPHLTGLGGLPVSPDGSYLLYTQIDKHSSNLMLIENWR